MSRSMTGYGFSRQQSGESVLAVEIFSVNRKHLDIHTVLPAGWHQYDLLIRQKLSPVVFRGHVTVRVEAHYPVQLEPNIPLAKQLYQVCEALAPPLHTTPQQLFGAQLLGNEGLVRCVSLKGEKGEESFFLQVFSEALEKFLQSKREEGAVLQRDLLQRIEGVDTVLHSITQATTSMVDRYRERLWAKIRQLGVTVSSEDERLQKEVFLYAEGVDISEECVRFDAHVRQLRQLLVSEQVASGKKGDFLLQELFREANTMGSKVEEIEIIHQIITLKTELERIREQMQNIE